jgi:peptide subunit release factor RF-3
MIKDEIKKCLEAEGVTPEWIIGRYKTIADVADRDTDRLRSLESLSKISGMFDTAEKKTEQLTVFAGFTPEQLEEVKNGKAELLAHKERESEG